MNAWHFCDICIKVVFILNTSSWFISLSFIISVTIQQFIIFQMPRNPRLEDTDSDEENAPTRKNAPTKNRRGHRSKASQSEKGTKEAQNKAEKVSRRSSTRLKANESMDSGRPRRSSARVNSSMNDSVSSRSSSGTRKGRK